MAGVLLAPVARPIARVSDGDAVDVAPSEARARGRRRQTAYMLCGLAVGLAAPAALLFMLVPAAFRGGPQAGVY